MKQKILVMGLPESGKTTLAKELSSLLNAVHLNGDEIRRNIHKDLRFSIEDRVEQARRMGWLCDRITQTRTYVVADFICPTEETRTAFGDSYLVFVDTIQKSRYEDTNSIFEPPTNYNFRVKDKKAKEYAIQIKDDITGKKLYSLLIGRFQPLHEGHIALIQSVLDEGKNVLVALRDTPQSNDNPYSIKERMDMFYKAFGERVRVITIPDISEVCYGRKVGWEIREIVLDQEIEKISATQIRKGFQNDDR